MKDMKCCESNMSDFSYLLNTHKRVPNFYCGKCGKHFYKKKWYTQEEWFFYINGVAYDRELHTLSHKHLKD